MKNQYDNEFYSTFGTNYCHKLTVRLFCIFIFTVYAHSRIVPPRLMRGIGFRGSRGGGGGSYTGYSSRPESDAQKLMNQLQGIVREL